MFICSLVQAFFWSRLWQSTEEFLLPVWCVMIGVTVTDLWWTLISFDDWVSMHCKHMLLSSSLLFLPVCALTLFCLFPFFFPCVFFCIHFSCFHLNLYHIINIYIHVHSLWFFPVFLPPCLHVSCRWAFLLVNALKPRFQHPSVSGRNSWDERCALGWARMLCQGWNATHITYVWDEGYPGIAFKHHQASLFLWDGTHSCTVWTNWG